MYYLRIHRVERKISMDEDKDIRTEAQKAALDLIEKALAWEKMTLEKL